MSCSAAASRTPRCVILATKPTRVHDTLGLDWLIYVFDGASVKRLEFMSFHRVDEWLAMQSAPEIKTARSIYPPLKSNHPQFMLPFGADDGTRAALRVFMGEKPERFLDLEDFGAEQLLGAWSELVGTPWPLALDEPLALSGVNLDPQVSNISRTGSHAHLSIALLATAIQINHKLEERGKPPKFDAHVGTIWSWGALDETAGLVSPGELPLATLERFFDYCHIDISGRRSIFFLPHTQREHVSSRIEEAREELDVDVHTLENALQLHEWFFSSEPATVQIIFVREGVTQIAHLIGGFGQVWEHSHREDATAKPSGEIASGTILNQRYKITQKLGSGGFATVYEATDSSIERRVAVKVIDLERTSDEHNRSSYTRRFQREARLAASVKHPCIVDVYDVGVMVEDKTPYIVMELLEGWDLEAQMRKHGPMRPSRLLPLFIQALDGLGCAHEAGIIHKDLKPSNIFLKHPNKRHERLCILDFGVARQVGTETSRLTRTDSAFGTPHYMAPEYSTSQIATPALDVYQMGLILVELLLGAPVVTHPEPMAAMFQHVRGDLAIPQALLDSELGPIIRRALCTEHTIRYQDGFVFADELRSVDVSKLPILKRDALRVSLNPQEDSLPILEHHTPQYGQPLIDKNKIQTAPTIDAKPLKVALDEASTPAVDDARDDISPFASTVPIEDISAQIPELDPPDVDQLTRPQIFDTGPTPRHPKLEKPPPRTSANSATREAPSEADSSHELIVQYSSNTPYVVVSVLLAIALIFAVYFIVTDTDTPTPIPEEVITEHDRKLAALRERVERLDPMLQKGQLDEIITEIKAIVEDETQLTPEEQKSLDDFKKVVEKERPNKVLFDRAMELAKQSKYTEAVVELNKIDNESVFKNRPEVNIILTTAVTQFVGLGINNDSGAFPPKKLDAVPAEIDQPDMRSVFNAPDMDAESDMDRGKEEPPTQEQ